MINMRFLWLVLRSNQSSLLGAATKNARVASSALITTAEHTNDQEQRRWWGASAAAAATAAGAAAATVLWPSQAACEQQPSGAAGSSGGSGSSWAPGWLSWLWGGGKKAPRVEDNQFLQAIKQDPQVAVVLCFALPSLSLSFGVAPSQADMDAAAALVEPALGEMRPWELAILLWGAARLGYHPGRGIMESVKQKLAAALAGSPTAPGALSPQEASMCAWALSVLDELTPQLWGSAINYISRAPQELLDEVALIHLYQAALFADRAAITAPSHPSPPGAGGTPSAAHLPRLRSASDEVRATLAAGGCPLPLINRCEREYKVAAVQPGFDGPSLIELSMIRLLVHIYSEGAGGGPSTGLSPYEEYFQEINLMDLEHARQLLADPYLLTKFKREIADKRARQNNFTRQLADISRTLQGMGVHHVTQAPVEDGLVHVDIALPDFKIAFFLEGAEKLGGSRGGRGTSSGAWGGGGAAAGGGDKLSSLDPEGMVLSGYLANETPGSKAAKLRLLQNRGWKVFPISWVESIKDDRAKRRAILEVLDAAGCDQLMRGRVSSALHSALRSAEESKLGQGRFQTSSAGQYTTRQQQ